ncbi:MAG TPA: sugar-binding domain-containing protein, partial [Limnochorda sp.]
MTLQITKWWMHDTAPGTKLPDSVFHAGDQRALDAWTQVELPANLIQLLVRQGRLPDPYVDRNTETARWTEERDWWFAADFDRPGSLAPWQRLVLRFLGVEPGTQVWLNGVLLGEHPSALRPAEWDVTDTVRPGTNRLVVRIPALGELPPEARSLWGAFDQRRLVRREPQMRYGWDWGPRLVMAGIWRPVELVTRGEVHLDGGVAVRTLQIRPEVASLEIVAHVAGPITAGARLRVRLDGQERVLPVRHGIARGIVEVAKPRLWWTHDLGRPELYTLEAVLESAEGHELDRYITRFGIRQIHLVQAPDAEGGLSFRFHLNGVPLFARGADWIPADSMLGSVPLERYRTLLALARDGNMNMIRVWGGGLYEDPAFYDACDELGILVWQDFMFACGEYPDHDPAFVREVEAEAAWAIKHLRNHPCIALWCGNNENDWLASQSSWEEPGRVFPGYRIYHEVLPALCAALDPTRPYWPSSPYGGDDPNSDEMGNKHNWQVWHGGVYPRRSSERPGHDPSPEGVNFHHYEHDWARFVTEFGIHGSPRLSLLRRYVTEPLTYNGEAFLNRIKDPNGNVKIEQLFAYHTGQPADLEAYEELSTLVQAQGMRTACEHFRSREPICSGALIWQLNDCWP